MIDKMIAYESGELTDTETLELFSELIRTGMAWKLQGSYGRTAKQLIDLGLIGKGGELSLSYFEH
jgi:hypothetical protein